MNAPDADFTKEQLWRALASKVDIDGKLVENPYKNCLLYTSPSPRDG